MLPNQNNQTLNHINRNFGYGKFEKVVAGAVKSAIDAHGPITKDLVSSVSKRVATQTWSNLRRIIEESLVV